MDPALTPYTRETARYTVPYSTQHTGTYNRALSMDPERLFFSTNSTNANTDKYINSANFLNMLMSNYENHTKGTYYSLDTKIWNLLEINRKTDMRGRIHVNEINYGKEIKVFVSDVAQEPEKCKSYVLLPQSVFSEVLKTRIKEHVGEPIKVQSSGDVWLGAGNKDKFVKVFVRK